MTDTFRKEYTPIDDAAKAQVLDVKTKAEELEMIINAAIANGKDARMMALAKTNLEQTVMWAVKGITG